MVRTLALAVVLSLVLGGCATQQRTLAAADSESIESNEGDPFERFNRRMFQFNDALDRTVLRPVARGYAKVVPGFFRRRVRDFFSNLEEPGTIVNGLLQGKIPQAVSDTLRFFTNTTIGIVGLFDIASRMGIEKHDEDFGQTFAVWGARDGPYLVLPLLGPSNVRDGLGLIPDFYLDPVSSIEDSGAEVAARALSIVDARSRLLRATRLLEMQLDPYLFTRESYRQRRLNQIHDGNPPQQ